MLGSSNVALEGEGGGGGLSVCFPTWVGAEATAEASLLPL